MEDSWAARISGFLSKPFAGGAKATDEAEGAARTRPTRSSILSKIFFSWVVHTIRTTHYRRLQLHDFAVIDANRTAASKHEAFQRSWRKRGPSGSKFALAWALLSAYRRQWLPAVALCLLSVGGKLASVVLYKRLLRFLQRSHRTPERPQPVAVGEGIGLVVALGIVMFATSVMAIHFVTTFSLIGAEIKTLLGSLMFEKSLVLAPSARKTYPAASAPEKWTQGVIINSMNTNTDRIELCIATMAPLIRLLVTLPMTIGLAWWLLGWAGLVAMCSAFVMLLLLYFLLRPMSKLRRRVNMLSDKRVELVDDIIGAIRLIKFYAWENGFVKRFHNYRGREVDANKRLLITSLTIELIASSVVSNSPILIGTSVYTHFHSGDRTLTVIPYFYLGVLFRRYLHDLPVALINAVNAYHAMREIQDFLRAPETTIGGTFRYDASIKHALELHDACFTWDHHMGGSSDTSDRLDNTPQAEAVLQEKAISADSMDDDTTLPVVPEQVDEAKNSKFTLAPLSFTAGRHELIAIVGAVGSGKSSIAQGLAGTMLHTSGEVIMSSKAAYCPQTPWIQHATVRDNIIFGQAFDESFYSAVIHACALQADLEHFPDGDNTMLGELGINISGGQKQRIQLARTLYQRRDIIIIDDALSAMDAHTAGHVFEHAILTFAAETCRLMITNQVYLLSQCARVIWIEHGKITATGTLEELNRLPSFESFMSQCQQQQPLQAQLEQAARKDKLPDEDAATQLQLMQDEDIKGGRLQWREYWHLLTLRTSLSALATSLLFLVANNVATVTFSLSITWWAKGRSYHGFSTTSLGTICCMSIVSTWISNSFYSYIVRMAVLKASHSYSNTALARLLSATVAEFDTTPLGRILNIFTSDLNTVDSQLPFGLSKTVFECQLLLSRLILAVIIAPLVATVYVPWMLLSLVLVHFYKQAPLHIKRLDRTYASLYTSKLTEGIVGRVSIKSCDRERAFLTSLRTSIDSLNTVHFTGYNCEAWTSMAHSGLTLIFFFFAALIVLLRRHHISPGLGVILLTAVEEMEDFVQHILFYLTGTQRGMASIGRIRYYCDKLKQEPPHRLPGHEPPASWPTHGSVRFDNVFMRYRPELPLVLHDMNLEIRGGERVGIVGRTGAGKSSIFASLMRTMELESGKIMIDGIDISKIGLHDLRDAIAVVPQDAILFAGTIRSNLLPPEEIGDGNEKGAARISDDVLNDALIKTHLIQPITSTTSPTEKSKLLTQADPVSTTISPLNPTRPTLLHLDTPVLSGGSNLSAGERQLLILARVLVRDSPIVLFDEATSAIDPRTDALVQASLGACFAGRTVVSIAHRVATIRDFDRVVVVDQGRVVESGPPASLYRIPGGFYRGLCERSNVVYDEDVESQVPKEQTEARSEEQAKKED